MDHSAELEIHTYVQYKARSGDKTIVIQSKGDFSCMFIYNRKIQLLSIRKGFDPDEVFKLNMVSMYRCLESLGVIPKKTD